MKELNLINMAKGDVNYSIISFPDGEKSIVIDDIDRKDMVHITCRIANAEDLFILAQVGDILNRQGVEFSIMITYLMGARMDRVIAFNQAFSLKVVADTINSLNPVEVELVEPHSLRAVKLIKNCRFSLINILSIPADVYCLPDAGALKRYQPQLEQIPRDKWPTLLICEKERNPDTGKLTGFKVLNPEAYKGGSITVIDDLCDGGGTFAGIAQELREIAPDAKLSIYVTHMVNSKGIKTLSENYDEVQFTDSYKNWNTEVLPENVKMIQTWTQN